MQQKLCEQIEALLRCSEHLQFSEELLERSSIENSIRSELQQQIDRVRDRQRDPNLYLAVVGEFSSGKSTFINALLQDDLLKSSALVATATAVKIQHGNTLSVEVEFSGTHPKIVTPSAIDQEVSLPRLPGADGVSIRQFIHQVTSQDDIAEGVTNLTITHPAAFLAKDITLIDTPGTNAENSSHSLITQRVVEQNADLAIVIVPATSPLSQTLADFLAGSLSSCLNRCIFIVTRMDEIQVQEQGPLLQSIRSRLVEKLNIAPPFVYACSAQVVLDLLSEERIAEHLCVWVKRFEELEKIIVSRLNRERSLSIAESILRLLDQLFKQLSDHLQFQLNQYETRQLEISRNIIPDLYQFAAEQHTLSKRKLGDAVLAFQSQLIEFVKIQQLRTASEIEATLYKAANEEELKKFLELQVQAKLEDERQQLESSLISLTDELAEKSGKVENEFNETFSEVYCRLQLISEKVEAVTKPSHNLPANTSNITTSAQSLTKQIDSSDGTKMGLSATAGVVIGTVLFPGIGSLIGLAVGTWASKFFAPSLQERKQKLWQQLHFDLDVYFNNVKAEIQSFTQTYVDRLETKLERQIDTCVSKYERTVQEISQEQKVELQQLVELKELTQADLCEIDRRQRYVQEQRQRIAAVN